MDYTVGLPDWLPAKAGAKSLAKSLDSALVVSTHQSVRSMMAHLLRQMGIPKILYASRGSEAKRRVENTNLM